MARARGAARSPRPAGDEPRVVPAAFVAALLVATSAAFVVTEKLKLTRNPIVGPTVDKLFSPVCDCATDSAVIRFRLRRADRVSVEIVDGSGDVVRELARNRPQARRPRRPTSGTGGTATGGSSARARTGRASISTSSAGRS